MTDITIKPDHILIGPLFNEPMKVVTAKPFGSESITVGLVGTQSERFRNVNLKPEDLDALQILDSFYSYDSDGKLIHLGLQAYQLGIAYEYDPYFGLSISRVDPLPHQLEAIYNYLLNTARVRFLLADDAGAGKTIMAGLLIRELKMRGLIKRILIVCPANLSFQWQREMKDKFDEKFQVMKGRDLREQYGVNQWLEKDQVITSLDLAKRDEILPSLKQVNWDMVIIDEAHRMSARDESHKSLRYKLGELLRDISDHILLMTATPHKGDPSNFTLFLQLLDQDVYADVKSIKTAMEKQRAPFYLRRVKEAMVYFPEKQEAEFILKLEKKNTWALELLLSIAERERDWVKAARLAKDIQKITQQKDPSKLAQFQVFEGLDKLSKGDKKGAEDCFHRALEIDPDHGQAHKRLGNLYADDRDLIKAIEHWETFATLDPDNAGNIFTKIEAALYDLGRYSEVEKFYKRMLDKDPKNLDALARMANVLEEKGERQQALELVDSAMEKMDASVHARLMRLKFSLTVAPPHELSQQIDKIIDLVTTEKEKPSH